MNIDVTSSTVTIAGRTFPACVLVCPPDMNDDHTTDLERSLGGREGPGLINVPILDGVYIPTENGLLINVEQRVDARVYDVALRCPTCSPIRSDGDILWIPESVAVCGVRLVPEPRHRLEGIWYWNNGEPEWVVELIDRLSKMPFVIPPGPRVTLKPLSFLWNVLEHQSLGTPSLERS